MRREIFLDPTALWKMPRMSRVAVGSSRHSDHSPQPQCTLDAFATIAPARQCLSTIALIETDAAQWLGIDALPLDRRTRRYPSR